MESELLIQKNAEQPEKDTEKSDAECWDIVDAYDSASKSDKVRTEWYEKYAHTPISFFSPDNIDELKKISSGIRLTWFGLSSKCLLVKPSDTEIYFDAFPQDLEALRKMITSSRPSTTLEFSLWAMVADKVFDTDQPRTPGHRRNQWLEINERREEAPYHLLSNYSNLSDQDIRSFGDASIGYIKSFNSANEDPRGLDERLETQGIFTCEEYLKLEAHKKIELLRLCLAETQHALVFGEANNSAFTRKTVQDNNIRRKQSLRERGYAHHNVAHSMLYGTYQPSSSYNEAQSLFEYEMNDTAAMGGSVEEYPYHRILLEILREFKNQASNCSKEDTRLLIELWDKNRNPIFANSVADALSAINPERASMQLIDTMKNSTGEKNALAALLYRLEFKRLGISADGVKYLNKIYDLNEMNDPNYFVERISPNGEMGIFNREQELLKYFCLDYVADDAQKVHAEIFDFAYETFFRAKSGESDSEQKKRELYIQEFRTHYFDFTKSEIFSENIRTNNFSFKEQGAAMIVMRELDEESKRNLQNLLKSEGESGLRVFLRFYELDTETAKQSLSTLSLCKDNSSRTKILGLLSQTASFVPRLEEEYVNAIKMAEDYSAQQTLTPNDLIIKKEVIPQAETLIMSRTRKVLKEMESVLSTDSSTIDDLIANANPQALLVEAILKTTRTSFESANLNDMPLIHLVTYEGGMKETNEREFVTNLRNMYKANYADKPKLLKRLLQNFDKTRKNSSAYFEVVVIDDKPIAFCAYEFNTDTSEYHFGKFNVDPNFAGKQLGEQMLEESLDETAHMRIIKAECDRDTKIASKYIERGFIATAEYQLDEIRCWDIYRNDSMNKELVTKSYEEDFIMKHIQIGSWAELPSEGSKDSGMVYAIPGSQLKDKPLGLLADNKEYVITRMFRDKIADTSEDMVIIVAEKIDEEFLNRYKREFILQRVIYSRAAIIM